MMRFIASAALLLTPMAAFAQEDAGRKATIEYMRSLQTSAGGFLSMKPAPNVRLAPTLRATSAAIRALHYLQGEAPNPQGAAEYVDRCFDAASGGFSDMPGGTPDVFATSVGLMAVVALKMPVEKYASPASKYLTENAKSFEDMRIAVAGLEAIGVKVSKTNEWREAIRKTQNDDGSFGKGDGAARATGSAAVALMRLGETVDREAVLKTLNAGQRRNGGFGKEDDAESADLETSYRIMRCYMMIRAQPGRPEGLRTFVAKCRNADGGYGVAPGQGSNIGAVYYAAIIQHWLNTK
ncbi:MAG: prenyltransferase/squalene oxidase repeat-containing protein [Gemmataceae bacterium]